MKIYEVIRSPHHDDRLKTPVFPEYPRSNPDIDDILDWERSVKQVALRFVWESFGVLEEYHTTCEEYFGATGDCVARNLYESVIRRKTEIPESQELDRVANIKTILRNSFSSYREPPMNTKFDIVQYSIIEFMNRVKINIIRDQITSGPIINNLFRTTSGIIVPTNDENILFTNDADDGRVALVLQGDITDRRLVVNGWTIVFQDTT